MNQGLAAMAACTSQGEFDRVPSRRETNEWTQHTQSKASVPTCRIFQEKIQISKRLSDFVITIKKQPKLKRLAPKAALAKLLTSAGTVLKSAVSHDEKVET